MHLSSIKSRETVRSARSLKGWQNRTDREAVESLKWRRATPILGRKCAVTVDEQTREYPKLNWAASTQRPRNVCCRVRSPRKWYRNLNTISSLTDHSAINKVCFISVDSDKYGEKWCDESFEKIIVLVWSCVIVFYVQ